jgi:Flp pilus assembly protein TadG
MRGRVVGKWSRRQPWRQTPRSWRRASRSWSWPATEAPDERGQLIPLIIGFGIIIVLLCSVVVDAAQAFTYRRALNAIADGAVLAATNGIDKEAIYQGGVQDRVLISEQLAEAEVDQYVAAGNYNGPLSCDADVNAALTETTVTCTGTMTLPIVNTISGQGTITIQVQSSAETFATP